MHLLDHQNYEIQCEEWKSKCLCLSRHVCTWHGNWLMNVSEEEEEDEDMEIEDGDQDVGLEALMDSERGDGRETRVPKPLFVLNSTLTCN